MVKEQSIKDQIGKLMLGKAIEAGQHLQGGKYKEAREFLRQINAQGRKLEWRRGKYGLKHLPPMEEVGVLKTKINEARAAVQVATGNIDHLLKLPTPELIRKLNKSELVIKERLDQRYEKEEGYKKTIESEIAILIKVIQDAKKIIWQEPWISTPAFHNPKNKGLLKDLIEKKFSEEKISLRRNFLKKRFP